MTLTERLVRLLVPIKSRISVIDGESVWTPFVSPAAAAQWRNEAELCRQLARRHGDRYTTEELALVGVLDTAEILVGLPGREIPAEVVSAWNAAVQMHAFARQLAEP